jgi:ribosomal protein L11 methyltransferase
MTMPPHGQPDEWIRVSIQVTPAAVEAAGELLRAAGCSGWENPAPDTVAGYFPADGRAEERIAALQEQVRALDQYGLDPGPALVTAQAVPARAWEEVWKEYFRPARIGRVIVAPTSEKVTLGEGEVVVRIDPGMAFGSGAHATTRLCLLALQQELRAGGRVLDLGTGSGILAIAASLLGASHVLAVDNDPEVVPIAQENAELNGKAAEITICEGDITTVEESGWDLVLANIAPGPVLQAAPRVAGMLAEGGAYVGAGIPAERADEVEAGLTSAGFRVERVLREAEWVAIVARPAGAAAAST